MGRYTTVQAYSDTNQNTRSVSYEQATGSTAAKAGGVKAEKVDNPYGSTAGAGSGEFHVYRHARAREMARMKQLDEDEAEQKADAEFEEKVSAWKSEEDHRTEKRRMKRKREKEAKLRKKNMKLGGVGFENEVDDRSPEKKGGGEEEFEYSPLHFAAKTEGEDKKMGPGLPNAAPGDEARSVPAASASGGFANDGSFLEQMKKKLQEENISNESNKKSDVSKQPEIHTGSDAGSNVVASKQDK